ncbi:MAG: DUF3018 family protein [Acidobacteria bacterium]|nr:DUF3018 family protein [Acidobacteriota bacterium]MYH29142.1 DUF3018 family protein [Acidobacteriota bacterium]MYK87978.1 DUF3018 family protein [Acidobacteriota bacterium]
MTAACETTTGTPPESRILYYMAGAADASHVLTFRASGAVVRALGQMARQRRQSRSELIRAILEDALRIESRDHDPAGEARRQSLLVSRRDSEREILDFIEHAVDPRDWR